MAKATQDLSFGLGKSALMVFPASESPHGGSKAATCAVKTLGEEDGKTKFISFPKKKGAYRVDVCLHERGAVYWGKEWNPDHFHRGESTS